MRTWKVVTADYPPEGWAGVLQALQTSGWTIFSTMMDRELIVVAYKDLPPEPSKVEVDVAYFKQQKIANQLKRGKR